MSWKKRLTLIYNRIFDKISVESVAHLCFLIAFALLPRADQLKCQPRAIPHQMVIGTTLIMAAATDNSLKIQVVHFHTMVGAQLVPLIGRALEPIKRFWVNWMYMPIHGMKRCCWGRTRKTWTGCTVWTTNPTRALCLITGSSRSRSHLVPYELLTTHISFLHCLFLPCYCEYELYEIICCLVLTAPIFSYVCQGRKIVGFVCHNPFY
jgi:hypothetical protein